MGDDVLSMLKKAYINLNEVFMVYITFHLADALIQREIQKVQLTMKKWINKSKKFISLK